jgi:hypothetical protein
LKTCLAPAAIGTVRNTPNRFQFFANEEESTGKMELTPIISSSPEQTHKLAGERDNESTAKLDLSA